VRRPFLTKRVLRGLETLALLGWQRIEAMGADEVFERGIDVHDALHAEQWVKRMTAFRSAERRADS
jgi:hypothetical protein